MDWYQRQCDGDWEHSWGVKLETVDNPGWTLTIDLEETDLEGVAFQKIEHDLQSDVSWWVCFVENKQFRAACGPKDLWAVINVFRGWVEANPSPLAGEGVGAADG